MFKIVRLIIRPTQFRSLTIPLQYQFVKVGKKERERQAKQTEKQSMNLSNTIDFEAFQLRFDEHQAKLKELMSKLHVGRLSPDMLDNLRVSSYGEKLAISSIAQVSVKGSGQLVITVFEESAVGDIIKTLENSDLNLQLKRQEKVIICQLAAGNTKESRIQVVNQLKKLIEDSREKLRDIRHECLESIKPYKKVASEDTVKKAEKAIQEIYEKQSGLLDSQFKQKEKELMNN